MSIFKIYFSLELWSVKQKILIHNQCTVFFKLWPHPQSVRDIITSVKLYSCRLEIGRFFAIQYIEAVNCVSIVMVSVPWTTSNLVGKLSSTQNQFLEPLMTSIIALQYLWRNFEWPILCLGGKLNTFPSLKLSNSNCVLCTSCRQPTLCLLAR